MANHLELFSSNIIVINFWVILPRRKKTGDHDNWTEKAEIELFLNMNCNFKIIIYQLFIISTETVRILRKYIKHESYICYFTSVVDVIS